MVRVAVVNKEVTIVRLERSLAIGIVVELNVSLAMIPAVIVPQLMETNAWLAQTPITTYTQTIAMKLARTLLAPTIPQIRSNVTPPVVTMVTVFSVSLVAPQNACRVGTNCCTMMTALILALMTGNPTAQVVAKKSLAKHLLKPAIAIALERNASLATILAVIAPQLMATSA